MIAIRTVSTLLLLSASQILNASENSEWNVLRQALRSGGNRAASVFKMLGTIDDPASREILRSTFSGKDGVAIARASAGLNAQQCSSYASDLARAAEDPGVEPKGPIFQAIARAGNEQSASVLGQIAESEKDPTAGLAFGALENMGRVSEPVLLKIARDSESSWARETAIAILGRTTQGSRSVEILRTALHDSNASVRVVAALRLAQLGYRDGLGELLIAAENRGDKYNLEAIVAYGTFGEGNALKNVEELLQSADEGVRGRAVWAIAQSGSLSLKTLAYNLRLEQNPTYRCMLAEKLFDPKDSRDRSELQTLMERGDEPCSLIAAQRLLSVEGVSSVAEAVIVRGLTSDNEAVRDLALKIASGQPKLRRKLTDQLTSPYPSVQVASLSVISELRDESKFAEVAHLSNSENPSVSEAAARTLVTLNMTRAKAVLSEELESGNAYPRIFSAAMLLASETRDTKK